MSHSHNNCQTNNNQTIIDKRIEKQTKFELNLKVESSRKDGNEYCTEGKVQSSMIRPGHLF